MSIKSESIATCSRCGARTGLTIYRSINTSEDPSLKDKVKDGSIFLWKCPSCGQSNLARYDTLYHDPDRRLMVWLINDGDIPESQMHSISLHAKAAGNYILRRVSDTGSLIEKVIISDYGLDDVVIEMCKYVVKMEMVSRMQDSDAASRFMKIPFRFFKLEGEGDSRIMTFVYPEDGNMKNINVGYNVYEDCLGIIQRNPQIRPSSPFEKVDMEWLSGFFR